VCQFQTVSTEGFTPLSRIPFVLFVSFVANPGSGSLC
jgi:hypothetical protein